MQYWNVWGSGGSCIALSWAIQTHYLSCILTAKDRGMFNYKRELVWCPSTVYAFLYMFCFHFLVWFGLVWCALFCFLGLVELKRSLKILKRSKLVNKFCVHKKIYMFAWRCNHSNSMLHEYLQVGSVSLSNCTNWKSFEHPNRLDKKTTLAQLMTWGSIWLTSGRGKSVVLETCLKTVIILQFCLLTLVVQE